MRELLITLSCLWALPFLAQNVPESSSEPTENSNKMAALHRQNMAVDTYFEKEEEKLKSKNTPGMADILVSVPAATEGFVIFKRQENGSIETSYVAGKKALLYARSYILNNKGAETETSKQNEKENITAKAPVQEAVNIIKSSIKLGKNLQSRYEQYKNGDRQERFQLVKDLIFGSGKKETKEESPAVDWRIKLFPNQKTGLLEVYANVVGLEIFVLDVEGNSLLKAGKIDQAFTELDPTGWPKNAKWLQFVKDGRVRVMKF